MNSVSPKSLHHATRAIDVGARRGYSSTQTQGGQHFYRNRQLEVYSSRETKRLTLRQLVFHGRAMNEDRLIKSANYVRMELPVRIAHRIRDMQALPYVVVTQENVAQVYELYWDAFEKFRRFPPVNNLEDNERFCEFVRGLLSQHSRVIPLLSLGLSLSSKHLSSDQLDAFMRRMLISRISRRVLAEHHIVLSAQSLIKKPASEKNHVGIIFTDLNVRESIDRCRTILEDAHEAENVTKDLAPFPRIEVDGHVDARFSYIREHLDYVILELLNNAVRFTRQYGASNPSSSPGIIRATIVESKDDIHLRISDNGGGLPVRNAADLFSFSHLRNATRLEGERLGALRSAGATRGSGLFGFGTVAEQLARFFPQAGDSILGDVNVGVGTVNRRTTPSTAANTESTSDEVAERLKKYGDIESSISMPAAPIRIGLGLPMSNIYATYFGGSLDLMSLQGWGTDVYLRLPKLGTNQEGIEV